MLYCSDDVMEYSGAVFHYMVNRGALYTFISVILGYETAEFYDIAYGFDCLTRRKVFVL